MNRPAQDSLKSFLNGEIRVILFAVALAFVVMSALFFLPAFGIRDVAQLDIVTKVLLPAKLLLGLIVVGTVVNAIIHLSRTGLSRNDKND